MVDVSIQTIDQINKSKELKQIFNQIHIQWLRLDVGFALTNTIRVLKPFKNIKGICINASTINFDDIKEWKKICKKNKLNLCACHNYYPKTYSGLSIDKVKQIQNELTKYEISTYGFISNIKMPKLPLKNGLTTVEIMRKKSMKENLLIAYTRHLFDSLIIADDINYEVLLTIFNLWYKKKIILKIVIPKNVSKNEFKILWQMHHFRNDSSDFLLRSETSRQYAKIGYDVVPHNQQKHLIGDITVDNSLFKRYSGELCLVTKNLPLDKKVNVVAKIHKSERKLIKYINDKCTVQFQKI